MAEELLDQLPRSEVVRVTRHPEALAGLTARGAEVRYGDFDEPQPLPGAFASGERVLLISTLAVGRRSVPAPRRDRMMTWGLTRNGAPKPVARAVTAFGRAVREGYYEVVDPAAATITGRAPQTLRDVLIAHRGDLLASG